MSEQVLTPELAATLFGPRTPEPTVVQPPAEPQPEPTVEQPEPQTHGEFLITVLARHDEAKRRQYQAFLDVLHPPGA